MRRVGPGGPPEPTPDDLAREGDLVEPFALVPAHARREDAAFPRGGGNLESGELRDDLRDAERAVQAMLGVRMLPAGEEAQELRGGDGLDLLAQTVERVVVGSGRGAGGCTRLRVPRCACGARRLRFRGSRRSAPSASSPRIGPRASRRPLSTAFGSRGASAANQRASSRATRPAAASSSSHACQGRPSSAVTYPIQRRASCVSSAFEGCGHASSRTREIASGSRMPISSAERVSRTRRESGLRAPLFQRRVVEERVRLRGEDAAGEGDGSTVSTARRSIDPSFRPRSTSRKPSTSIASVRQSSIVCATIGWSIGTSMGPPGRSGMRSTRGKAVDQQVVARIRLQVGRLPVAVPRPVEQKAGAARSTASASRREGREDGLDENAARRGGVQVIEHLRQLEAVRGPSERTSALLVRPGRLELEAEADAEALPSASPHALLIFEPNGACTTSCMPPLSSKKRSRMTRFCVGTAPERLPPRLDVLGDLHGGALRQGFPRILTEQEDLLRKRRGGGGVPFDAERAV